MRVTVIIPIFNGAKTLPRCLAALAQSTHAAAECIVVDDGSTDNSAEIALRAGAKVISTGGRTGPARARNLGAQHATSDLLFFVDSDVCVHGDALRIIVERFTTEPDLTAIIGAYDDAPPHTGLVSQFKNLQHAYTHRNGNSNACTFWSGCGGVRRSVFLNLGGFDETYREPSIEDIEFGFRMFQAGYRLALDPGIQCTHLKNWTLINLVRTDVFQRGIPWTRLILRTGYFPDDLNLKWSQRVSLILCGLLPVLWLSHAFTALTWQSALLPIEILVGVSLALLALIWLANRSFYGFLASRRGSAFSAMSMPIHILYYWYSAVSFVLGASIFFFRDRAAVPIRQPK